MVAGIGFVLEDPGRYALQTVDRLRNYYRFWPEPSSSTIANVSRVLSFGLYLPFMLYGLLLSKRNRCCAHQVILIYLYIAVYSAIHLLSWAMHRYRLPVDAVVMVFVGLALLDIFQRMSRWYAVRFRAGEMSSP
jgi:fumarate reductase subunit D